MIDLNQGHSREAEDRFAEGLRRSRSEGDAFHVTRALVGLSRSAVELGDLGCATALLEQALSASESIPDQRLATIMAGRAFANLGVVSRL